MANIYVRSTDGNDADNGSTWALANATLAGAAAIDAAGDTVFVADGHSESNGTSVTLSFAGTTANPVRVLCVNDTGDPSPPTALATGAVIETTGAATLTVAGSIHAYGLTLVAGNNASASSITLSNAVASQFYENCTIKLGTTAATGRINISNSSSGTPSRVEWKNCIAEFSASGQVIRPQNCIFNWSGGSVAAGTSPTAIFNFGSGQPAIVLVEGVDFSALAAGVDMLSVTNSAGRFRMRNCKLPASWSGALVSGINPAVIAEMHNCDAGDTNYRLWLEMYAGKVLSETTIVRTGGASDGTTALSWRMETNANANFACEQLVSPEIVRWNETVGSSVTVTVEVISDNVTLTDAECWLEVQYLGTSGFPLASFIDDAKADTLATAANQTTSTETWTTTGLTTPVKQKLSVSFTPQEKGFIHARIVLAKPSTTVYVDPLLTVA